MMKRFVRSAIVAVILVCSVTPTAIFAAAGCNNACHSHCASQYPNDVALYDACMVGCCPQA